MRAAEDGVHPAKRARARWAGLRVEHLIFRAYGTTDRRSTAARGYSTTHGAMQRLNPDLAVLRLNEMYRVYQQLAGSIR